MSIFSAIRSGLSKIKSAVASVGSRIKSAGTGGRRAPTPTHRPPIPGELFPQPTPPTQTPATYDDLRAPTTQEIRDARYRFKASHADSDLSDYSRRDVDTFYAATKNVWRDAETPSQRNDLIREYFEAAYGMDDLEEIYDFVVNGSVPDTDDMIQADALDDSGEMYRLPALYFG